MANRKVRDGKEAQGKNKKPPKTGKMPFGMGGMKGKAK